MAASPTGRRRAASRIATALALLGCTSCRYPTSPPADIDGANDAQLVEAIAHLRSRIDRIQARLDGQQAGQAAKHAPTAETGQPDGTPADGPASGAPSAPPPAAATPTGSPAKPEVEPVESAGTPDVATLIFSDQDVPALRQAAELLAELPPKDAREVLQENWKSVTGQARAIKVLHHMDRKKAEALLRGMPQRLVRWVGKDRLVVYSPEHPLANPLGFVRIELIQD